MVDIKIEILREDFNAPLKGLIVIPPGKNLKYGLHKLLMNSLSIVIDRIDSHFWQLYSTGL
jgi:hypothetical protein